jgi:hypothetical protein
MRLELITLRTPVRAFLSELGPFRARTMQRRLHEGDLTRLGKYPPMTRIVRTTRILAPENAVIDRVQNFFSAHPKLQVKALGSATAGVEVQYYLLFDWLSIAPRREAVAFAWRPAWHGFPAFGATLTVRQADKETELVLEGSYEPPGGAAGRFFDRVVGRKLAARTMDAFLNQLADNP